MEINDQSLMVFQEPRGKVLYRAEPEIFFYLLLGNLYNVFLAGNK